MENFYRHPAMADGHLGKCKACAILDARINRVTMPRARQYDRERARTEQRKRLAATIQRRWKARNPDRARAQAKALRAHRNSPMKCEGCGLAGKRLERHHPNYELPLAVVWLCKPCHAIGDKIRRRVEEALKG